MLFQLCAPRSFHSHTNLNHKPAFQVKATVPDSREKLDHPQRMKKGVAPTGLWERFPTGRTVRQMTGEPAGRTPWEMKEEEKEYKMRFDMPGMSKDDVKDAGGESGEEEPSAKSYGRYSSRIVLPENVVVVEIRAEVKDVVLYILFPKAAASFAPVLDIHVQCCDVME